MVPSHAHDVQVVKRHMSLHSTDFVPTGAEARSIRAALDAGEKSSHAIDFNIAHSTNGQAEDSDIVTRRLLFIESYSVKKEPLAPIRRLPPEILGDVFLWCTPEIFRVSVVYNSTIGTVPEAAPLLLIQVCKRWRHVALGTPELWTQLGLHGICGINPLVLTSTWLRRSGSLPIDIYINPLTWGYSTHLESLETFVIPKTMQLLAADFHRCRVFHSSNHPSLLGGLFPQGSRVNAPLLRDLRITSTVKSSGDTLEGRIIAPALETLDICDPHATLRSITMNHNKIRIIRWNGSNVSCASNASLDHLASLLRLCPNVEECDIIRPTEEDDLAPRTVISLPRLRHLSLLWNPEINITDLLDLLAVPVLEHLRLEVEGTTFTRATLARILHSLIPASSPSPPLKELHVIRLDIAGGPSSSPRGYNLITPLLLPNVERLRFKDCTINGGFLEVLTPRPDQPLESWALPKLSSLHLTNVDVDGSKLVHMVAARLSSTVEACHSCLKLLSLAHCREPSRTDRAVLRGLIEDHCEFFVEGLGPLDN